MTATGLAVLVEVLMNSSSRSCPLLQRAQRARRRIVGEQGGVLRYRHDATRKIRQP